MPPKRQKMLKIEYKLFCGWICIQITMTTTTTVIIISLNDSNKTETINTMTDTDYCFTNLFIYLFYCWMHFVSFYCCHIHQSPIHHPPFSHAPWIRNVLKIKWFFDAIVFNFRFYVNYSKMIDIFLSCHCQWKCFSATVASQPVS